MEFLIFLVIVVAVVAGVFWAKKHFRNEIDRPSASTGPTRTNSGGFLRRVPSGRG